LAQSDADAFVLEIGARVSNYSAFHADIDMLASAGKVPADYTHRDGTPYWK